MINNIYEDISSTICGCNGEDDIAWDLLSNNYEQHRLFDDAIKYNTNDLTYPIAIDAPN